MGLGGSAAWRGPGASPELARSCSFVQHALTPLTGWRIANAYGGSPPARCFQRFVAVLGSKRNDKGEWKLKAQGLKARG